MMFAVYAGNHLERQIQTNSQIVSWKSIGQLLQKIESKIWQYH